MDVDRTPDQESSDPGLSGRTPDQRDVERKRWRLTGAVLCAAVSIAVTLFVMANEKGANGKPWHFDVQAWIFYPGFWGTVAWCAGLYLGGRAFDAQGPRSG